jgi:hypothetical protein
MSRDPLFAVAAYRYGHAPVVCNWSPSAPLSLCPISAPVASLRGTFDITLLSMSTYLSKFMGGHSLRHDSIEIPGQYKGGECTLPISLVDIFTNAQKCMGVRGGDGERRDGELPLSLFLRALALPTSPTDCRPDPSSHIRVVKFGAIVKRMSSIRRPKRLVFHGHDEKEYFFLVKVGGGGLQA